MTTKFQNTDTLLNFLKAFSERKKNKGDAVAVRHAELALQKIHPDCIGMQMFIQDTSWKFVPVPESGEPKDPVESDKLITKIKDEYYAKWIKELEEGKYDPDSTVTDKPEEDKKPDPIPEAEVKDTYEEAEDIATAVEEKVEATKADTTKDQELSLNLGRVIRDIARSVAPAKSEVPVGAHLTDMQSLIDAQEKRIKELEARADKSKDVIISLVQQVKALQQPKSEGVEGL